MHLFRRSNLPSSPLILIMGLPRLLAPRPGQHRRRLTEHSHSIQFNSLGLFFFSRTVPFCEASGRGISQRAIMGPEGCTGELFFPSRRGRLKMLRARERIGEERGETRLVVQLGSSPHGPRVADTLLSYCLR